MQWHKGDPRVNQVEEKTKKHRAFCTEHAGGLWYGPCRDKQLEAEADAKAHGRKSGHTEYDVESDVDPAECE